ncbi:PREDICTED: methyl-CpG-binding domain-containing protein 2-like isoform X2 [Ipomoea nil]|uniref:methyl-CpG-binding domain-containing protein 2-like isoform X2 n=1 Tax=Ipomoea nil TaxID=35883 RepID=UPI000901BCD9|nr:PREDICTED: methyl-CpG-binding domain-containing protein 2-like isoform X2 [Ipomoea nil]
MEPSIDKEKGQGGINSSSIQSPLNNMTREPNDVEGASPVVCETSLEKPININSGGEQVDNCTEDDENENSENAQNQLVLYDPSVNGASEIASITDQSPPTLQRGLFPNHLSYVQRPLPSVGAFTVQCANCFKWRLIPTKEKYEEIREHILEDPFFCETAREWRPDISCDDPPDIIQDGSRLWAIDKPNIAQPPPGWQRLLRIRGEGGSKFADVYYVAPSGKRFRSMVEIQKYLEEHPEVAEGVRMSQFSFQIPKPLQDDYVKKRSHRSTLPHDDTAPGVGGLLEANPISWIAPHEDTDLRLGGPGLSTHPSTPVSKPLSPSTKKMRTPSKMMSSGDS